MCRWCRYAQRALCNAFRGPNIVELVLTFLAAVIAGTIGFVDMFWSIVILFGLLIAYHFIRSLWGLNRAPRPFSDRDKRRLLAVLADHRNDFDFPLRLTIVPLYDPGFAFKIGESFAEGGWEVTKYPYSIPPGREEGIWVFGTNQPCKELAVQAFASLGLKAKLDNSSPTWPFTLVSFGR